MYNVAREMICNEEMNFKGTFGGSLAWFRKANKLPRMRCVEPLGETTPVPTKIYFERHKQKPRLV